MSATTITITSDGSPMDESYRVVSLVVTKVVDRIPTAEIELIDGSAATREFPIADATLFAPGASVEIKLRDEGDVDHSVFTGIVVRQFIASSARGSTLTVQLKDPAVVMTRVRESAVYSEQTDADVLNTLISDAGLTVGDIPATSPTHTEIVRYRATAWDFLVSRADVNGLLVVADAGTVSLAPMDVSGSAAHTFELGMTPIYDVEIEMDGESQWGGVESTAWDPASQQMTAPAVGTPPRAASGEWDGGKIAGDIGNGTFGLTAAGLLDPEELAVWADARLARNRLALVRGRLSVPGRGDVALLDVIDVSGMGTRFSGTTMVTGLVHRMSKDGWSTVLQFGVSPGWFCDEPLVAEPPAGGMLPPVGGLQIGVVAAFEEDPAGELRVRVLVPGIDADAGHVWARLAVPDAGPERGWFWRPEVDDEVVLGFVDDDPRQPVILGALYSSTLPPPADMPVDADNFRKGIVTRGGTKLVFDDETATVTVQTPAANTIVLDDDAEEITVTDQHGSSITLSADGVLVTSAGDLELTASGDVKISADGNVEIAGSKVDVK